ncbi:MAG: 8-oxo-dGTP diphosphatase [Hydrocarboniphaga sp.]|uniref:Nudix family hydrolase n=1 Tax=Hydrocarboniphaga sp. TaxID=2033016 RepID=UPI002601A28C|nr:Nudix family hydrolase [Hydrocarboniphaga sp.]MDB5971930.1 8-oxo-dGTP diphosphatase [Hydrocarboniphaga sp.]
MAVTDDPRPLLQVACGVLQRADGAVLLAQRPPGKIAAGFWEFPGGKIEPGESAAAALARELHEELGVTLRAARPLIRLRHAYSNRIVVLDTWLVSAFDGEPESRENQALAWTALDAVGGYDTLPTVAPILKPLRLPPDYVFTPPMMEAAAIRAGLSRMPKHALLRLRLPALGDAAYAALASSLAKSVADHGLRLVLDRDPALSRELGCGWHAPVAAWRSLAARPDVVAFFGSAHTREELLALNALDADAAVLGHVQPTNSHANEAPLGWTGFAEAALEAGLPVYAIGGVGPRDHERAWNNGGQGCAGINAYWLP